MGSTNANLENKNEGKSSRRSFIRKWGLLSLGTIFAASQMTNKMPKVHAEVLDNAESNDISKDVIRISKASASTDVFVSGQTAEDLANSVNGLSKSFSDALASLKNTAVAKAINAAGTTFTDVIASLATIADKSGFAKTLSAPEKVIIPAGYHDGTGFVDASALMKVPTQTLTLSAPTNGTDCINYAKVATSGLMKTPTANLDITSNGTFTVTNYKTVKVDVSINSLKLIAQQESGNSTADISFTGEIGALYLILSTRGIPTKVGLSEMAYIEYYGYRNTGDWTVNGMTLVKCINTNCRVYNSYSINVIKLNLT